MGLRKNREGGSAEKIHLARALRPPQIADVLPTPHEESYMPAPAPHRDAARAAPARPPREDEIDAHGVTHPGKVRPDNQDHFLLCSLRKQLVVRGSSLPEVEGLLTETERLASLAMVADGVGGAAKGETASRVALRAVTQYVSRSL